MARLLLVRHGESEWNAIGRWQGQLDPPLSDLGRKQAAAAARSIGQVDLVVASDLERAAATAIIIADELGIGPVEFDARLRERYAAAYQGLTRDEIEARFPGQLEARIHPPGWEDDGALSRRALAALDEWSLAAETVLVVTHGGLIRAVERHLGGGGERLGNLGGLEVTVAGDGLVLGERRHLVAVDVDGP